MAGTTLTEKKLGNAFSTIEMAVRQVVEQQVKDLTSSDLKEDVMKYAKDFIKAEYGAVRHDVVIYKDEKPTTFLKDTVIHEQFDTVSAFIQCEEPVYLVGPAGCGKNVLAEQIAKVLGMNFMYTNAVTQEYQLKGFTDAMGVYQPTAFYKAFTEGGLFMLDEVDGSIPEAVIILNMAIANGEFDFPAPIGNVKAHPNFRVICAGNTVGTGANYQYVGRNQLDGATLDRFGMVKMDYDPRIESMCAEDDEEVLEFLRDFRQSADKSGVICIVSYRGIRRFKKMVGKLSDEKVIQTCLVKGMDKDDVRMVLGSMEHKSNKYAKVLDKISKGE